MCPVYPSLPQNIKIIKELHIPIEFKSPATDLKHFDAYAVLDHPSVDITGVTGILPCAIHVDHHKQVVDNLPVDFKLILEQAGSTSSIFILLLNRLEPPLSLSSILRIRSATALYLGIQTDTDNFQHSSDLDTRALDLASTEADKSILRRLARLSFPKETVPLLHSALQNQTVFEEWLVAGIGYVKQKFRDSLAIIADFLVKREDVTKVMVFAIIEGPRSFSLHAVFRTKEARFNLNRFIKQITSHGGARTFKGAYQIDLEYFQFCPDPDLLWKLVYITTLEALKRQGVSMDVKGLKRIFHRVVEKIKSFLQE
jgi:nanoRNase/pAp phosphatase (c-di-AMP/oligoRNAs hydrolase)